MPEHARGWTQCDNRGGGYSVWISPENIGAALADLLLVEKEAKTLRTRAACESALRVLGVEPGGTCEAMRLMYQITKIADLWPLRQVS